MPYALRSTNLDVTLGAFLAPATGYTVTVACPGAVCTAGSSSTTATVAEGHGFINGDKFYVQSSGVFGTISGAPTQTTLPLAQAATLSSGDVLVNLGADTGSSSPNWDGSRILVWSDPGVTAITQSRITVDSAGNYEYHHLLSKAWEYVRNSSGTLKKVIKGIGHGKGGDINVRDYGAQGNYNPSSGAGNDDTNAIQRACDIAVNYGGRVYIPAGYYKTTAPITMSWTASPSNGLPNYPKVCTVYGDGGMGPVAASTYAATVIFCTALSSGRGVFEFLGESNGLATRAKIEDLQIVMKGALGSPAGATDPGAYCLRFGDAINFEASRMVLNGANGVLVKISSSASYAQLGSLLRQLYIYTNYGNEWYTVNDANANLAAVGVESGGAFWDSFRMEECNVYGTVITRASIAVFDGCTFATNAARNNGYNYCVSVGYGAARFSNCYFEDYYIGCQVAGNTAATVRNATFDNCNFVSTNNSGGGARSYAALYLTDAARGVEAVSVNDCVFTLDAGGHSSGAEIYVTGTMTLVGAASHNQSTGLNDLTSGGTYSGTASDTYTVQITATGTPDTFKWTRNTAAGYTTGVSITGAAQTLDNGVTVTFAATTGHTLNDTWTIPVGLGGPNSVVITNPTYTSKYAIEDIKAKPRITLTSTFTNHYWIQYHTGEIQAGGRYAAENNLRTGMSLIHTQDTTARTAGGTDGGIELSNLDSTTSTSINPSGEGGESAIKFRGNYTNPGSRYAAIYGRVSGRNSNTQREGGVLGFATKTTGVDTLTEAMRIEENGRVAIGHYTPVSPLDVRGTITNNLANGQLFQVKSLTELTTIAASATTDTAIQIPANAVVFGVSVFVQVAIPTAATFTVIGTSSSTAFNTAAVSVNLNSSDPGTLNCPYKNGAAQTIRITPNLTPGNNNGRVRVTIHYYQVTAATS